MTSDTPRTDSAEPRLHSNAGGWVRADLAKQLERELAHSLADQLSARNDAFNLANALSKAEAELLALQRLRPTRDDVKKLERELAEAKREAEYLATAMHKKYYAAEDLDGITNDHVIRALRIFGREKMTTDGSLESWINLGADRLEKAKAELAEANRLLKNVKESAVDLIVDGKEALERAEKAEAEVERLKQVAYDAIAQQDFSDKRAEKAQADVERLKDVIEWSASLMAETGRELTAQKIRDPSSWGCQGSRRHALGGVCQGQRWVDRLQ